jgi:hypothetical protein
LKKPRRKKLCLRASVFSARSAIASFAEARVCCRLPEMPLMGPFSPRKSATAPLACSVASRAFATAFSAWVMMFFALT